MIGGWKGPKKISGVCQCDILLHNLNIKAALNALSLVNLMAEYFRGGKLVEFMFLV